MPSLLIPLAMVYMNVADRESCARIVDAFNYFKEQSGDPLAASNLTLAWANQSSAAGPADKLLTAQEAAEKMNVSIDLIYDLVKAGKLRSVKINMGNKGKRETIRIAPADLAAYQVQSAQSSVPDLPDMARLKHLNLRKA